MKRLTALSAVALFAVAMTVAPTSACEKSCSSKSGSTQASFIGSKSACSASKTTTATTASAEGHVCKGNECAFSSGKYAVSVIKVDGMTCGGCENGLASKLTSSEGVLWVANVSYKDGQAKVVYEKDALKEADLLKMVDAAGFKGEIIPAVAFTSSDSDTKLTPADHKKACSAAKASYSKAACSASKASASNTTAFKSCGGGSSACATLTDSEKAAFCAKFCQGEKKAEEGETKKI